MKRRYNPYIRNLIIAIQALFTDFTNISYFSGYIRTLIDIILKISIPNYKKTYIRL